MNRSTILRLPGNTFAKALVVALPLHLIGVAVLFATYPDVGWALSWVVTATGSAIIISGIAVFVSWLASRQPRVLGQKLAVCALLGFAAGWVFSVLGGALISFHPVMLLYIVFFGGAGLVAGLVLGSALGLLALALQRPS